MHVKYNREKGHWEGEKEGGKRASVTGPTKQPVVVLPVLSYEAFFLQGSLQKSQ